MSTKPELVILCGLPGSGKSTLARRHENEGWLRINYDHMRFWSRGKGFNKDLEKNIKEEAQVLVRVALNEGKSVIIDNTNLTDRARAPWLAIAKEFGIEPQILEMNASVEECVINDKKRTGVDRVGRAVIERMALTTGWLDLTDKEAYPKDFVLVDVDGTLADLTKRKKYIDDNWVCCRCDGPVHKVRVFDKTTGPKDISICQDQLCLGEPKKKKDWLRFFAEVRNDTPHHHIISLVTLLSKTYDIFVVSGRPIDRTGIATEEWLHDWVVPYRHLFMRNGGDFRPDDIVKKEILEYLPWNRIKYVLDDRDRVVKMWRENGLHCLQVAPGDF